MQQVHRGDIFYADLSPVVGSEQGGHPPGSCYTERDGEQTQPDGNLRGDHVTDA